METILLPGDAPSRSPDWLQIAQLALQQGQLVAFPTDTVYGLAADVHNAQAIASLFDAKGRQPDKAIAVLVGSPEDLDQVTLGLTPSAQRLAQLFWPGPLTLVVARHPNLPPALSPASGAPATVGVRMPNHPMALALLQRCGPLAVTSANRSGAPNTCTASEVLAQLSGRISLVLDGGRTPGGSPSTVVDCTAAQARILRAGPISEALIQDCLGG